LLPDSQSQPETNPWPPSRRTLIAPLWHTAVVVFLLLGASLAGARSAHPLAARAKLLQYLWTMSWEWLLTGFIVLGVRRRISLRELIGGRWNSVEAVLRDVLLAACFWLVAIAVLGIGGHLLRLDQGGKLETMRRQLGFLVPATTLELLVWFCLCATAGFCEEIIFRGYLQKQFALITRSTPAGVVLSAIIFGAAHGYEGGPRMVLIGIYGLMFGLLAAFRKSLRPGMIAHAWHDALAGAVMRLLK
jgi:CAAX protease family protein